MARPRALGRTLHRCRVHEGTPSSADYPGTTTKLFNGGKLVPKRENNNNGNYHVILGMYMGVLGKQKLAKRSQEGPVYWQPLTKSKREMTGLRARRPCFFLSRDTRPKTLPSQAQRACLSQLQCWPWALNWSESSAAALRLLSFFQSDFSRVPVIRPYKEGRALDSLKVGWGGVGGDFAIKLLIKELPT